MKIKTAQDYLKSLRKLNHKVYYKGKRIKDVTRHPATAPHVRAAAMTYALANDPEYKGLATATSHLTGKTVSRFTHVHRNVEDLIKKVKLLRALGQKTGSCFQRCVGLDGINAVYSVTYEIDQKCGTDYFERFKKWLAYIQEENLMVVGAMTDPKGDRSKGPAEQVDPETQILHQAAEIFVLCDHQGRIIRASQSTNRLFGRSPIFQAFDEAFHLLYPDGTPFVLLSAMSDKFLHAVEVHFKHGDNESFSFLLRANSLITHKGAIGIVVVMVDITERKKMEGALQKAHDKLEQQVEERTVELQSALSEIKTMKDQLEAENIYFRREIKMRHHFAQILGQSDGLKYVLYRAEQVAPMNTTVLILGETGTGKDLIAAAIHDMSPRKDRPLITVNCAALPGNLIESELFGREKGAFTGADTRQVGRFEIANGSTLCLDEIGELPLEVQAKLLRVIQYNEFERLGSSQTIKVDVRIVATTNRNLEEEVRKGRFRQDLYYRLNVFPITVPPLRQRKEDIPLMVQAFIERYSRKLGKQITSIQKETMKALQDYPWPGNVRELESIIERAVILCPGPVLQLADKLEISSPLLLSAVRTLEETERNQILKILSETRWRIEGTDGAAAILGLHPSTLRARMHKLGILRLETKEPD